MRAYVPLTCRRTADYLRYLAEFSGAEERTAYAERASTAYERARELAGALGATHPVRLGLSLNLSVFEFEIRSDVRGAFEVAALALRDAVDEKADMLDAHRKDAMLIMQLLKDNLQLWSGAVQNAQSDYEGACQCSSPARTHADRRARRAQPAGVRRGRA